MTIDATESDGMHGKNPSKLFTPHSAASERARLLRAALRKHNYALSWTHQKYFFYEDDSIPLNKNFQSKVNIILEMENKM